MSHDLRVNPALGCDYGLRRLVVCTDHLYERYYTQITPPKTHGLHVVVTVVVGPLFVFLCIAVYPQLNTGFVGVSLKLSIDNTFFFRFGADISDSMYSYPDFSSVKSFN